MLVPVVVFVVCFAVGVVAAARWLPELAPGIVGGLAFFVTTGLLAAALTVVGLDTYALIRDLSHVEETKPEIMAAGLRAIFFEGGTLLGFAAITYLLAPRGESTAAQEPDEGA